MRKFCLKILLISFVSSIWVGLVFGQEYTTNWVSSSSTTPAYQSAAVDTLYLDQANKDIYLTRSAANTLKITATTWLPAANAPTIGSASLALGVTWFDASVGTMQWHTGDDRFVMSSSASRLGMHGGGVGGASFYLYGQTHANAKQLIIDADGDVIINSDGTGNVGIGTAAPDKLLSLSDGTDKYSIDVGTNELRFWNDAGTPVEIMNIDSIGSINAQSYLRINDANTGVTMSTDAVNLRAGGVNMVEAEETGAQDILRLGNGGSSGADVDVSMIDGSDAVGFFFQGSTGSIGIGTTAPDSGLLQINTGVGTYDIYVGLTSPFSKVIAGSGWVTSSDSTLKRDIVLIDSLIDRNTLAQKFLAVKPVRFRWNPDSIFVAFASGNFPGYDTLSVPQQDSVRSDYIQRETIRTEKVGERYNFGFIGQEFADQFGGNPLEIDQDRLKVVEWQMIQELTTEVIALRQRVTTLEGLH